MIVKSGNYLCEPIFLFDLDSTITKQEILPLVAERFGCGSEMRSLTEKAMYDSTPFRQSFLKRVELLKEFPIDEISNLIDGIELNEEIVSFIQHHLDRCFIVTGNLDVWITKLIHRIGLGDHLFCSKAIAKDNRLVQVASVIDKLKAIEQFVDGCVAIGDGSNDAEMVNYADLGIGFGAVRPIAPSVLEVADYAFYDEEALCRFLKRL